MEDAKAYQAGAAHVGLRKYLYPKKSSQIYLILLKAAFSLESLVFRAGRLFITCLNKTQRCTALAKNHRSLPK